MTKAPREWQDLRRRIYRKAKADRGWRFWGAVRPRVQRGDHPRSVRDGATERRCRRHRRADVRSHRGSGAGRVSGRHPGRTAYPDLATREEPASGDPEGRRQGPPPGNSDDPGPRGARCAETDPGAGLRSGLSGRILRIPAQAHGPAGSAAGDKGSRRGQDHCDRLGFGVVFRHGASRHPARESGGPRERRPDSRAAQAHPQGRRQEGRAPGRCGDSPNAKGNFAFERVCAFSNKA